jgi:HSP20 family protein
MTLVRWEPARELSSLQHEMNRLFGTFFESGPTSGNDAAGRRWIPAMDLVEGEDSYLLRADLPGLTEDDVKLEYEDDVLTVSGERKTERQERKGGYVRYERASGLFSRSLTLPAGVDANSIEASFANGVLEVKIPKPVARQPHRIEIGSRTVEGVETAPEATATEPIAA